MSKKNKAKFKKHIKAQILQEMGREINVQQASQKSVSINTPATMPSPTAINVKNIKDQSDTASMVIDDMIVNLPQVKHDLKKTAIIILILAAIIAVLSYLAQRYNILISFGDWLFKVLNIK